MGKLLDPDPGDVIDRASILALKLIHAQGNIGTDAWETELGSLTSAYPNILTPTMIQALYVAAINGCVWEREEVIRNSEGYTVEALGDLALGTRRLNDRKAAILQDLNGGRKEKLFL